MTEFTKHTHKPLVPVPDGLEATETCSCGSWRIVGWTNRFGREQSAWQPKLNQS